MAARAGQNVRFYLDALRVHTLTLGLRESATDNLFLSIEMAYTVARSLDDPNLFRQSLERLRAGVLQMRPFPAPCA